MGDAHSLFLVYANNQALMCEGAFGNSQNL